MKKHKPVYNDSYTEYMPLFNEGIVGMFFWVILITISIIIVGFLVLDYSPLIYIPSIILICAVLCAMLYIVLTVFFMKITISYEGFTINNAFTKKERTFLWHNVVAVYHYQDLWFSRQYYAVFLHNSKFKGVTLGCPCDVTIPIGNVDVKSVQKFIPQELLLTNSKTLPDSGN